MRKKILLLCLLIATAGVLIFQIYAFWAEEIVLAQLPVVLDESSRVSEIDRHIASRSLDEKIGQLMMVSIPGVSLSTTTAQWLRSHHIGGVLLLGKNVKSAEQTRKLIAELQENAAAAHDPPLLVAVDQEGGIVSRFRFLNELTAQKDVNDAKTAFRVGLERGKELRELGVNVNFSPVLDRASSSRDFIFSRTFRGDSKNVAQLGEAMIRGYEQTGMISVGKHFPGHGGTTIDSHKELPIKYTTYANLADSLQPFKRTILAGVPMVMVGHIKFPFIDNGYPASLSSVLIGKILRTDLGYRGVVITDDLGMGAITRTFNLADAGMQAIKAGEDILLVVRSLPEYDILYARLKHAVERGEITEQRIDESIRRILLLKETLETKNIK
jgi:beta-N-acetylhexosaminidase